MSEAMLVLISQLQHEAQLAEDDYRTLLRLEVNRG